MEELRNHGSESAAGRDDVTFRAETGASSTEPLDPSAEWLLRAWIEKAEADLEAAERLATNMASSGRPSRDRVPKTHDIESAAHAGARRESRGRGRLESRKVAGAIWRGYPVSGDAAEMVPGDEAKTIKNCKFDVAD